MTAVVQLAVLYLCIWRATANLVASGHRVAPIRAWRVR